LCYYWHDIKDALVLPVQTLSSLRDGFWPVTQFASALEDVFLEDGSIHKEYDEDDHFVGQRRDCPAPSFRVLCDLFEGYFVAVRPADGDSRLLWITRVKSDPNCNPERPNCVLIQYFQPTSKSQVVQETYRGWDSAAGLRWKVEDSNGPQWEHMDSIMTAWKSGIRWDTTEFTIKILSDQITIIRDSIATYGNDES
jgi:hypothetical protein